MLPVCLQIACVKLDAEPMLCPCAPGATKSKSSEECYQSTANHQEGRDSKGGTAASHMHVHTFCPEPLSTKFRSFVPSGCSGATKVNAEPRTTGAKKSGNRMAERALAWTHDYFDLVTMSLLQLRHETFANSNDAVSDCFWMTTHYDSGTCAPALLQAGREDSVDRCCLRFDGNPLGYT